MKKSRTVAQVLAESFVRHGVKHIFGIPGGGSSLDVIRACHEQGIKYVLTRTEAGAGIMAAISAELNGGFGVMMTTQGPGTLCATNGVGYACVDRAPIFLISDGWTEAQAKHDTHQKVDQQAIMAPITKAQTRLEGDDVANEVEHLIRLIKTVPHGPAYIELTGEAARRVVDHEYTPAEPQAPAALDDGLIASARKMIAGAKKPVVIVGLEAREPNIAPSVRAFVDELHCPVFSTYKAKGVVPEELPRHVGLFTGASAEKDCVNEADLIILVGFDPVELIGRPWPYAAPVLDIAPVSHPIHYVEPEIGIYHPLAASLDALKGNKPSEWTLPEIENFKSGMRERLVYHGEGKGLTPDLIVSNSIDVAQSAADPRLAIDAGAHMISAMAMWQAKQAGDVLISNGIATMAFALPAAISAWLHEPERRVLAFTGDGGFMMCAGELSTAAQTRAKICLVVFNDQALSMIGLKQKSRQLPAEGVEFPPADFSKVAEGFGVKGFRVDTVEQYKSALEAAMKHDGPCLIDARVDPSGYLGQITALRG